MTALPLPTPDADSQPFWDFCSDGELRAQRCLSCGTLRHPPRPICAHCGSFDFEWQRLSGRGSVFSFTVTRQAIHPALEGRLPHVVVLVQLEEGLLLTSNLVDVAADEVAIGLAVEVVFEAASVAITLPKFRRASGASARD